MKTRPFRLDFPFWNFVSSIPIFYLLTDRLGITLQAMCLTPVTELSLLIYSRTQSRILRGF